VLDAAEAFLHERGPSGLSIAALVARVGVPPESVDEVVQELIRTGRAERARATLVAPAVLTELKDVVRNALRDYHRAQPLSDGLPREEARERFGRANAAIFERALDDLVRAGEVVGRERLALRSHTLTLSEEEAAARDAIEQLFRGADLKPPDPGTLSETLRLDAAVVDRMVKLLLRQKALVKLDNLLFHADALERLKEQVVALKSAGAASATVDVGAFKTRHGVTRKFAIPLLEYLDRERVTRRVGDVRIVI
jgi:selenocysteine-specific elongation factor